MKLKFYFFILLICFVPNIILSQAMTPEQLQDIFAPMAELIANYGDLSAIGIIMLLINFIIAFFKSPIIPDRYFNSQSRIVKRVIIVVLGQVLAVSGTLLTGGAIIPALFGGLVSSGGAVAIWQAVKPLFKK